ncbi:MAG: YdgA family protein [Pigmentiphaga sp.]|nr:YdgA family protein [Pigmentiphaga sp.]
MKKLSVMVVCSVVVLGLAWAGTAWWTGHQVEEHIRAVLAEPMPEGPLHEVALLDYQRGVMSSTARYRVSLVPDVLPESARADTTFEFDATVHHGPWPWPRLKRGKFTPVLATAVAVPLPGGAWQPWFEAAKGAAPVTAEVDVAYSGELDFRARLAPIELLRDDTQLIVAGGVVQGTSPADLAQLQLQGRVPEASLRTVAAGADGEPAPTEVVFHDVRWQSRNHRGEFGIYPGQAEIEVRRMDVVTTDELDEPLRIVLHDYRVIGELAEQGEHLSGRVEYDVGRLEVAGIDLGRLDAALRLERLHGPTVRQILANYRDLTSGAAPGTPVLPKGEELDAWWRDSLEALLPERPVFALDPLRWELPQGRSWIQVEVALQPAPGPIVSFDHVAALDARLVVSRPMAVEVMARLSQLPGGSGLDLEQARAAASMNVAFIQRLALASGYVTADADALMAHLSYADGRFTLNDEPLDLPAGWGRWLSLP